MNESIQIQYTQYLKRIEQDIKKNGNIFDKPHDEVLKIMDEFTRLSEEFFRRVENEKL